jgi:hypothetical protein
MFTHMSDLTKGVTFYVLVFVLVVGVTLAPLGGPATLMVAMLMPALATVLMLLVVTRDGYSVSGWASLGLHRAGVSVWPLAVLGPLAVIGVAYSIVWSTGVATFTQPEGLDAAG